MLLYGLPYYPLQFARLYRIQFPALISELGDIVRAARIRLLRGVWG